MSEGAARLGDPVGHSLGMAGMIGGAMLGAVVGAALLGATIATGGLAGAFAAAAFAGVVGGGMLAGGQLANGLQTVLGLASPTTGTLAQGSPNVRVNGRPAVRAGPDFVATCNGLYGVHHFPKPLALVAEGSATVRVNGKPAARVKDRLECAATITAGSTDVFIGGGTQGVVPVQDTEALMQKVGEALVWVGLAGAAGLAGLAGGVIGVAKLGLGALGFSGANAGLGWMGDQIGPGYRDLFQGALGVGTVAAGPRMARAAQQRATAQRVRANVAASRRAREASNFGGPARPPNRAPMTRVQGDRAARKLVQRKQRDFARTASNTQFDKRKMLSAVVNRRTGTAYVDFSGNSAASPRPASTQVSRQLRAKYPSRSKQTWPIENCAEFKAANRATTAEPESTLDDLSIYTVDSKTGKPMHRCFNCQHTTEGASVPSDRGTTWPP